MSHIGVPIRALDSLCYKIEKKKNTCMLGQFEVRACNVNKWDIFFF